ncbi:cytochrome P450 [Mycena crocata]|nr:cytochrome P450 [Mycena crocata]
MFSLDLPAGSATWAVGLGLTLIAFRWLNKPRSLPLPPGPPGLPLLGNVFDLPAERNWERYMDWAQEYNTDILHLNLAGTHLVVLSSLEATDALLEKRSSVYSDRAPLPMVSGLMGFDFVIAMMRYGEEWRAHRRLFKQAFTPKASLQYQPKQMVAAHTLLRACLKTPEDFLEHFRQWASEIIMAITYGIDVLPVNDPYVELAFNAVHALSEAGVPGKYLVDSIPLLKYVPSWMPGAKFKRDAKEWKKLALDMRNVPFAETKRQMASGNAPPSFAGDCINALNAQDSYKGSDSYYTERTISGTAATMYVAGADTTVSALGTFVLAMLSNPDAQRKAQEEIDSVTGGRYLPTFEDEAEMPYVAALVQEILRWKNVGPIAFPHFTAVEDEYKGYRIPANSIVIGNTWAILHDESVYPDPYAFKPERFLKDGKLDPELAMGETAFGYGRRICPGRHTALHSLWITVACFLATFDIKKARDEHGREIEPSYEYDSGFITAPLPFKCSILPRSEAAAELIRGTAHV